jgi:hypothetical protein
MPKFNEFQSSFSMGQLSPTLEGRSDLREYMKGLGTLENAIPTKIGALAKRPGVKFQTDVTTALGENLMEFFPFYGSNEQVYVVRLVYDQDLSTFSFSIINKASRASSVVTVSAGITAYPSGAKYVNKLHFAQSGDVLIITGIESQATIGLHYEPIVVVRTGDLAFDVKTWSEYATGIFAKEWEVVPYFDTNVSAITLASSSAALGATTVTAVGASIFTASDIGSYLKIQNTASTYGVIKITGYTSGLQVTGTVLSATGLTEGAATTNWARSAWSNRFGWPRTLCFHRQRLLFANTKTSIDSIWCSRTRNIAYFMQLPLVGTGTSADPFELVAASDQVSAVQWLSSAKYLDIGTTFAEFSAIDGQDGFTNAGTSISRVSSYGSAPIQPVKVGSSLLFVDVTSKIIRELYYDTDRESNVTNDLSIYSDRVLRNRVVQMQFHSPTSTLYVRTGGNSLATYTFDPASEDLSAWATHSFGGGYNCAMLAVFTDTVEFLHRTATSSIIGVLSTADISEPTSNVYADLYAPWTTALPPTSFTAAWLANKTVGVLGSDGISFLGYVTCDNAGVGDLTAAGIFPGTNIIYVGLPYTVNVVTMLLNSGAYAPAPNTAQQGIMRIDRASLRLYQSGAFKIGTDAADLQDAEISQTQLGVGQTATGLVTVQLQNTADYDKRIYIKQETPLPLMITGILYRGVSSGE